MDRFLLAENVNLGVNRPLYILQSIKHKMLIEIVPYEFQEDLDYKLDDVFDFYEYINSDGLLEKYMFIVRDFYDLHTDDEIDLNIEKIRKDLDKAWKWYKSYLIKSDKEIDSERGQDFPNLN